MAEISNSTGHDRSKAGVRRSKKLSTKVDLTPMVDLGFLLITFFVFTSAISKPTSMHLYLPAGTIKDSREGESRVLTIIPSGDNQIFYYHGKLDNALATNRYGFTRFAGPNSVGDIIRQKQLSLSNHPPFKKEDLMLIIKPNIEARYENVVNALDEIQINALRHYAFVDLDPEEKIVVDTKKSRR
jgi:Biopolymer transport protein ExbD/TolR